MSSSLIGKVIGFGAIILMLLVWGFFLSEKLLFVASHEAVLILISLIYCIGILKSISSSKRKLLILIAFVAHFVLLSVEKGEIFFSFRILSLIFPYLFLTAFGSSFIPLYAGRVADAKIRKNGVDAMAIVTEAWDEGARLTEDGVYRSYKMKLTLKIINHTKSPYKVTGIHWVSEFYIHRLTGGHPIPVIVDKKNPKKVTLNFGG